MASTLADTIYVLHSAVPDMFEADGTKTDGAAMRGQEITGQGMRAAVATLCAETSAQFGLKACCRQADCEDELIDLIREADTCQAAGLVIDADAYSSTSSALQEVLASVRIPTVELRPGNARADATFRHHRFTATASLATLSGFGIDGYRLAIRGLAARTGVKAKA